MRGVSSNFQMMHKAKSVIKVNSITGVFKLKSSYLTVDSQSTLSAASRCIIK
jgi:hypothetical protein